MAHRDCSPCAIVHRLPTDIFPLQQRCLTGFIRNSKYCCFYPQIAPSHADFSAGNFQSVKSVDYFG
jgi:hypothetical protein